MVAPTTYAAPNPLNYSVGRGILYAKDVGLGDTEYVDLGNVTMCEINVKPTILKHFNSRLGTRKEDSSVVTEIEATVAASLEEFTARNMSYFLLGTAQSSGSITIDMYSRTQLFMSLMFVSTGPGPQWTFTMPRVQMSPQKALSLIPQGSGSWGTIDINADILFDPVTQQFLIAEYTGNG